MNTHITEEQLIDYLHGELAPGADAALLLHLEGCGECRVRYDAQARLSESLRAYARATERELPLGFEVRVRAAIESSRVPAQRSLPGWVRPALAIPVAAVLAIGAYFTYGSSATHRGATTIDAAFYLDDHAALTSRVPFDEGGTVPSALFTTESVDGAQ
ncbi:MAG TPA: zf-HC2 domain-containing protein [Candidatus Baltobacteraceae bacterium]|nr:zf-HC2 domain-containing protein [Candidatus Baltobacteraceae bacterium]